MAATLNLSHLASLHTSRRFSLLNQSSRFAPTISFYSHPIPSSLTFPSSLSLKPHTTRPRPSIVASALKSLASTEPLVVPEDSDQIAGVFPPETGVYAVFDGNGDLQFVGISRNIAASVLTHRKSVPDLCRSVKVGVVEEPDKEALTQAWKSWMEEHIKATGKVPSGNESGNATWARPAPRKKADLRLTPGRHVQLTVPMEQLIDRMVKENRVVAFIKGSRSAPQCGFSQRVIGILESHSADFESVDVLDDNHNAGLREALKAYSNWPTFPQVFVGGELVGGCDIITAMHEKGELGDLLSK